MFANDVDQAAENFLTVGARLIETFSMIIRDLRMTRYDDAAFRERVCALAMRMRTSVPSLGVHFQKGLPVAPE